MKSYSDDDLLKAENGLRSAQRAYLTKSGWKTRSDTPGSIWLWHKEIDGREYFVTTGTAIYMQRSTIHK